MAQEETQEEEKEEKLLTIKKENSEMKKNHLAKEDLTDHQEMERKKVSVTKENLVLEINQNPLVTEDLDRSSRDGEKKSFGYKGKSSFGSKDKITSKPKDLQSNLQITQNILEKNHLKV